TRFSRDWSSDVCSSDLEGDALIDEIHAETDAALEEHAALKDAKLLFAYLDPSDLSQVMYYTPVDTRPGFLAELGLPEPAVLADKIGRASCREGALSEGG